MSHLLQLWHLHVSSHSYSYIILPLLVLLLMLRWFSAKPTTQNLPPSPPKLPIIGNLHQLGTLFHQSLFSLSQKTGPLMRLQLGTMYMVVASSSQTAREIMKTHDHIFCDRPEWRPWRVLYDQKKVSASAYGEYWRQAKSTMVVQLLSNKKVHSFRRVKEQETTLLVKNIAGAGGAPVDLSGLFMSFTNDLVCRVTFGRKLSDDEDGRRFDGLLRRFFEVLGGIKVEDVVPQLAWIDCLRGVEGEGERIAMEIDGFLEKVVEGRMGEDGECFVDSLLKISKDEAAGMAMDREVIKALMLDIYTAGTDTTATVLEWVMTELLKHPTTMTKLQAEVRTILNGNQQATEDDLAKMHYLKAVIKETLRLHPPIPTLVPRVSTQYVKIMGYDILKGTRVLINAWAIGRDPQVWDQPERFRPERFLSCSIDFRGHDFGLIPFGAGRRGCPGISFAMSANENVIASLVNRFDWVLPDGGKGEDLDTSERPGLTVRKRFPLLAVAIPFW